MGQVSPERIQYLKRHTDKQNATKRRMVKQPQPKKGGPKFSRQGVTNSKKTPAKRSKPKVYPTWHWAWTHPYLMTAFAFGVSCVTVLLHVTDLIFEWPFHRQSLLFDSVATFCGLVLAVMCVDTYRDLPKHRNGINKRMKE